MTDRVTAYGPLEVGDLLSVRSGGGGGFGPPDEEAT
jgi:N-methylhydantoinase B/oxoprolinase/acetone carboxylase alpha subunit